MAKKPKVKPIERQPVKPADVKQEKKRQSEKQNVNQNKQTGGG